MKKLTKSQLKRIAKIHAGCVILATESVWAFETSELSSSEKDYLDKEFEKIGNRLLNGETPIFDSRDIVKFVCEKRLK